MRSRGDTNNDATYRSQNRGCKSGTRRNEPPQILDILYTCTSATPPRFIFFFFNDPPPPEISTLSLHDALPIWIRRDGVRAGQSPFSTPLISRSSWPATRAPASSTSACDSVCADSPAAAFVTLENPRQRIPRAKIGRAHV